MKYFLIIILFFVAFFCEAQPLPNCLDATKRLFIKSNDKILFHELNNTDSYIDSSRVECFKIYGNQLKDSINTYYFKVEIYQSNNEYQKEDEKKMFLFVYGINLKDKVNSFNNDSFNLYLKIPKFKEGIYFIDVSKLRKIKKVNCQMCRDTIDAIDITPKKWCAKKRWKN